MSRFANRFCSFIAVLTVALVATSAQAATGTWSTTAATGVLSDGANWSTGGPIGTATAAATADTLTFDTSTSTTLSQTATNLALNIDFSPSASAYTWNTSDFNLTIGKTATGTPNTAGAITNNSTATQIFNMGVGTLGIYGTIGGSGPMIFNGSITPGHNLNSTARTLTFANTGPVYLNVDTSTLTGGAVLGGNGSAAAWAATSASNNRARMFFNNTGTVYAGNIGNAYLGSMFLSGATSKLQLTAGTFAGSGGANGNSRLTIDGTGSSLEFNDITGAGITFNRNNINLENRANLNPHIRNIAGNNTIQLGVNSTAVGPSDWNTTNTVNGNWNFKSDAGKLTVKGGNFYPTSDNVTSTLQLMGNGDGQIDCALVTYSLASMDIVKSDAGTWTLTNIPVAGDLDAFGTAVGATPAASATSVFKGAMTVTGGKLALSGNTTLSGTTSVDVRSGKFFDVSGITGPTAGSLTLNTSNLVMKGAGTVTGSLVAGASNTFAPGDSGVGTFTISNNLTLNGGGVLAMELTGTPTDLGGINDRIAVGGNLTLAGSTALNVNPVNGSLGAGKYTLLTYVGSLTGDATNLTSNLVNTPRQSFTLDSTTANEINLIVAGGAANLTWVGGVNGDIWVDGTTEPNSVNWTGHATDNHFYNNDNVTFGDSGTNTVNVSGTVTVGNVNFTNNAGENYTINGSGSTISAANLNVSGSGNTTVASGNFIVNGAATMSGSGTFEFTNSGEILTLPATVALNSGTLALNRTDDFSTSAGLTGSGTFRKDNTNTVTATGDSSGFNGAIQVTGGTLKVANANALGSSTAVTTVSNGATLDLNGTVLVNGTAMLAGTGVGGSGALVNSSATGAVIPRVGLTANTTLSTAGSFYTIGDGTAASSFLGGGFDLDVVANNEIDVHIPGDMGVNNINLNGGGNVFYIAGGTTLGPNTGTLTMKDGGRLGFYGNGGGAGAAASTGLINKPIVVESSANGGELEIYRGNKTIASPIQLDGNLSVETIAGDNGTWTTTLTGPITGAGNLALHVRSSNTSRFGVVELTSDGNTYTGTTTIGGGGGFNAIDPAADRIVQLLIGNGGATGSIGTGDIIMNPAGGTLGTSFILARTGTYTLTNNIIMNGDANVARVRAYTPGGDTTISGIISGAGQVIVGEVGSAALRLSGNNTYTGVTTLYDGTLEIRSNTALGDPGNADGAWTFLAAKGATDVTGAVELSNNITSGEFFWLGTRAASNMAPHIINKSGHNTLSGTLSSDYGGNDSLVNYNNITLRSDGVVPGDLLEISGNVLQGPSGWYVNGSNHALSNTANLNLQGAGNGLISGPITEVDANWVLNVVKDGAGKWTLSGANSYTGNTSVDAGILSIANANLFDGADVFVQSGAMLELTTGTFDIIDSLFFNGASQAVGTWGGLTSTATNKVPWITGSGILQVTTTTSLNGDYNLDGKVDSADYVVWRKDPGTHGGAGGYDVWRQNFGNPPGAGSGSSLGDSGAAVPEPTTCALLVFAGLGLLSGRRARIVHAAQY
jgi:fibronectin-binding autotransporter adhesin